MKKLLLSLGTAMLMGSTALAYAALPVEGVYEKVDAKGNVVARMQVWDAKGSLGKQGINWNSPTLYPYISLQLFENNKEIWQIGTSYCKENDSVGTADMAIVLDKKAIAAAKDSKAIKGSKRNSVAGFGWQSNDEVSVKNYTIDDRLDGMYHRTERFRELPPALIMYAHETNVDKQSFYKFDAQTNFLYTINEVHGPYMLQNVKVEHEDYDWKTELFVENDFNLIIEKDRFDDYNYYFPFIHQDLVNRTEETWGNYRVAGTFTEAAAMLAVRKIIQSGNANLRPTAAKYLRFTDFYTGEGENAVSTHRFEIQEKPQGEDKAYTLGKVDVSDNGEIRIQNFN